MATQAIPGYSGRIQISTDGGSTYTDVAQLRNVTLKITTEMQDASNHDSAGGKEVTPGPQTWGATADGLYNLAATAHAGMLTAVLNKTLCKFYFDPAGTASGKERFSGDGYISNWENSQPTSDFLAVSIEITGSGNISKSTQA